MSHPLFDWLEAHMKPAFATLRAGCDEAAIRAAESKLGRPLQPSFARLYREHDGQDEGAMPTTIFEAHRWLPLAACIDERRHVTEVLDEVRKDFPEVEPWDPAWLPFAADDVGNLWAIDLVSGAVFAWSHDRDARPRLADSFDAFVTEYVDSFARGERIVDPRLGAIRKRHAESPDDPRGATVDGRTRLFGVVAIVAYVIAMAVFVVMLERCRARRVDARATTQGSVSRVY